ncbi:hypothetical protein [Natronococcus wangiae]|uniref:hypothetical protein n=1 Tax=Natronococcus wangiae TaxID=3068275 RepID=UPI00273FD1E7|nr:hypothetical protein [Natronococcus sp. AD5]
MPADAEADRADAGGNDGRFGGLRFADTDRGFVDRRRSCRNGGSRTSPYSTESPSRSTDRAVERRTVGSRSRSADSRRRPSGTDVDERPREIQRRSSKANVEPWLYVAEPVRPVAI